jgi:hypothetical protein
MLKPIQFLAPGLLGWAIASGATFGAAITLVNWRHNKLLRRLRLAPVNTGSVVLARVGVSLLVALIQMALFLLIATTPYFGLKLTPGWWMAIPVLICGTLAFMSIGLLVGSFAKTQQAATAIANLIILPMAFLGGAFIPLDFAPAWLVSTSYVMPLRYLVTGMQGRDGTRRGPCRRAARARHPGRADRGADDDRGPRVPLGRGLERAWGSDPWNLSAGPAGTTPRKPPDARVRRGTGGRGPDRVRSHMLVTPSGRDHGLAPGAPKGQPPRNLSGIRDRTGQASLESARRA